MQNLEGKVLRQEPGKWITCFNIELTVDLIISTALEGAAAVFEIVEDAGTTGPLSIAARKASAYILIETTNL